MYHLFPKGAIVLAQCKNCQFYLGDGKFGFKTILKHSRVSLFSFLPFFRANQHHCFSSSFEGTEHSSNVIMLPNLCFLQLPAASQQQMYQNWFILMAQKINLTFAKNPAKVFRISFTIFIGHKLSNCSQRVTCCFRSYKKITLQCKYCLLHKVFKDSGPTLKLIRLKPPSWISIQQLISLLQRQVLL